MSLSLYYIEIITPKPLLFTYEIILKYSPLNTKNSHFLVYNLKLIKAYKGPPNFSDAPVVLKRPILMSTQKHIPKYIIIPKTIVIMNDDDANIYVTYHKLRPYLYFVFKNIPSLQKESIYNNKTFQYWKITRRPLEQYALTWS